MWYKPCLDFAIIYKMTSRPLHKILASPCAVILLIFLMLTEVHGQREFASPVAHPLRLSGTFGELRTGHFHTGIDIKSSKGGIGDPIYAVADGFVSRIMVSAGGYGKVIYIDHPNGYTSVYAHLDQFTDHIEQVAWRAQMESQMYEVDITLPDSSLSVSMGEQIGMMGNSGFSFGPHLHFEIRLTASDTPINPMSVGWVVPDSEPPIVTRILAQHISHEGQPLTTTLLTSEQDSFELGSWRMGLLAEAFDPFNYGRNKNGIYHIAVDVDGRRVYEISFDSIPFTSRDFRTHVLEKHGTPKSKLHRCFALGGTALEVSPSRTSSGIIPLYRDRYQKVDITIQDFAGNSYTRTIMVRRQKEWASTRKGEDMPTVHSGTVDTLRGKAFQLIFDTASLYHPIELTTQEITPPDALFCVHLRSETPVLKGGAKLLVETPVAEGRYLLTSPLSGEGSLPSFVPSVARPEHLETKIFRLGDYCLVNDTIAPRIILVGTNTTSRGRQYHFQVSDNLDDIPWKISASYAGEWLLHSFDLKDKRVSCVVPAEIPKDATGLELRVSDAAGNTKFWQQRSP